MNENVNVQNEKKGVKPAIVFLLVIIFSAIFGVGGWFLGTKYANNEDKKTNDTKVEENNDETNKDDNVVADNGYVEEEIYNSSVSNTASYTYIDQQVTVLKFGDTSVNMYSKYYIDKETVKVYGEEDETVETYILRRRIYINDKLIGNTHMLGDYETMEEAKNVINKSYSVEVSSPIKDTKLDKYYLILSVDHINSICEGETTVYASDSQVSYIVDENGNVMKRIKTKYAGTSIIGVYADAEMIKGRKYTVIEKNPEFEYPEGKDYYLFDHNVLEIYDDYLYYIAYSEDDMCNFVEKKLVITNGLIVEELSNTYIQMEDIEIAGASC